MARSSRTESIEPGLDAQHDGRIASEQIPARDAKSRSSPKKHSVVLANDSSSGQIGEAITDNRHRPHAGLVPEESRSPAWPNNAAASKSVARSVSSESTQDHEPLPCTLHKAYVQAVPVGRAAAAERSPKRRRIAIPSSPVPRDLAGFHEVQADLTYQPTKDVVEAVQQLAATGAPDEELDRVIRSSTDIVEPQQETTKWSRHQRSIGLIDPAISNSAGVARKEKADIPGTRHKKSMEKTKGTTARTAEDAATIIVEDAIPSSRKQKRRRQGRKRETTPENAETVRIESSAVRMVDLCSVVRTGKRSLREKGLREIDAKAKMLKGQTKRASRNSAQQGLSSHEKGGQEIAGEGGSEFDQCLSGGFRLPQGLLDDSELDETQGATVMPTMNGGGSLTDRGFASTLQQPATRIINGEIVLDESSLRIDRHAHATSGQVDQALETIEESDLTRHVTAGSWVKRDKTRSWNDELTELFYEGLRMFGTDFGMISKMFADRTRHAVKRKFCLEEKLYPARIEATLRGERLPVDLHEFSQRTNTIYEDPGELEREMAEDRRKLEDDQAREKQALEEARLKRVEEAAAESAALDEHTSIREPQARQRSTFKQSGVGLQRSAARTRKPMARFKKN